MRPVAIARKRWPVRRDKRCGAEGRGERGWDRLQEARGKRPVAHCPVHQVLGRETVGSIPFLSKYHTWTLIISQLSELVIINQSLTNQEKSTRSNATATTNHSRAHHLSSRTPLRHWHWRAVAKWNRVRACTQTLLVWHWAMKMRWRCPRRWSNSDSEYVCLFLFVLCICFLCSTQTKHPKPSCTHASHDMLPPIFGHTSSQRRFNAAVRFSENEVSPHTRPRIAHVARPLH